tara:strand:+ start:489 stop:710 length:222 start_codon:yes stop_codon:yes gene_type:complete
MSEKIEYTFELLYHFTCKQCKNWWSYSITPSSNKVSFNIDDRPIHCMHCGTKGKAIIKKGFDSLLKNQNPKKH